MVADDEQRKVDETSARKAAGGPSHPDHAVAAVFAAIPSGRGRNPNRSPCSTHAVSPHVAYELPSTP